MPASTASAQDNPGAHAAAAFLRADRGAILAPVRSVLFGRERFHEHGLSLARAQGIGEPGRTGRFYPRLDSNLRTLHRARAYLDALDRRGESLSPAAEWLLDNFHLIEAQLPEIRAALPRRYYANLPKLAQEPLEGLPRIYGIAWAFVAHTDSSFDAQLLSSFLAGYQQVSELTLGELWALPTTLRVVLLENLARLADMVATNKAARELADACCDEAEVPDVDRLDRQLQMARERGVDVAYLSQLEQRLRPTVTASSPELHDWLLAHVPDANAVMLSAQELQAANNVSVGHAVMALRAIENHDWERYVAGLSAVIGVLGQSPAFLASGELTRDQCTHAVERIARELGRAESEVARESLRLSEADAGVRELGPSHVLIGSGRPLLLAALGVPHANSRWRKGLAPGARVGLYLGLIACATAWLVHVLIGGSQAPAWMQAVSALLLLIPVSEFVIAALNRALAESVPVARLPRANLRGGIPSEQRTLVVVPCLLGSPAATLELALALEQHHLAAQEQQVQYALLSDWADADAATQPQDADMLAAAVHVITELNLRHPRSGDPCFLLLHRERSWSESEQRWMGWERKRGKIERLVSHLAGDCELPFIELGECSRIAPGVRYIVTLDSDTRMPPGALREMVAIAAHPLNRPQVDAATGRVVSGYGILQPRVVTPFAEPQQTTFFSRVFSGPSGIDVYNAGSSDVYQDAFGEGSFSGKGLIDVRAFHATLAGRVPEGRLLSHDLYEGLRARCALLSDVSLIEEQPTHPDVAASREHRWTRGDWQLLPFFADLARSRVGALNLWKLIDNLRRSLLAPASVLLLWWSFTTDAIAPPVALLAVLMAWTIGPLMSAMAAFAPSRDDIALRHFFGQALADLAQALSGAAWRMAVLLQSAALQLDAILRALWRMQVSHRLLLQWTPAAQAQAAARSDAGWFWRRHAATVVLAVAWAAAGLLLSRANAPWLIGFGLLWALTPLWLWLGSQHLARPAASTADAAQSLYLHELAQHTWRFFQRHVAAEDNHLPPDNLQLEPRPMLAHRTSPTNIGLYLLSLVSAQRLGYIGSTELIERLRLTLETLDRLPRHRGHYYNWIDTQSLRILEPAYVSTVDSGNLAAALWAVAEACRELALAPPLEARAGAAAALQRAAQRLEDDTTPLIAGLRQEPALRELLDALLRPASAAAGGASADHEVAAMRRRWQAAHARWTALSDDAEGLDPLLDLLHLLGSHLRDVESGAETPALRNTALFDAARRFDALAQAMEFGFLYDAKRRLFHIGYRVAEQSSDSSYYDLLASESRLTSFIAIAKGDVPQRHWQALGRPFLSVGGRPTLRSWSGSMFEYLMPSLLMTEPTGGLLQSINRSAVQAQQRFGAEQGLPWGVSESAYFSQDHTLAFQYSPFGVPSLALRRTPPEDRVIAPYATVIAAMVDPAAAVANLRRLQQLGARGAYGFIEALDATESRLTERETPQRVATVMAHHQGMSLVALCNLLCEQAPRRWFGEAPLMKAHAALLQERLPREIVFQRPAAVARPERSSADAALPAVREIDPERAGARPTQLLGNGNYSVSLRPTGAGASVWRGRAITRSRDDALRDSHGHQLLLRGSDEADFHSLTLLPAPRPNTRYLTRFFADHVEFDAACSDWDSQVTVFVSPDDDVEFRQIQLHNRTDRPLVLQLASRFEAVLAPQRADEAHPAFSNLFVRAMALHERCLALERRPRLAGEAGAWAAHFIAHCDLPLQQVVLCADRARLMPRLGAGAEPAASTLQGDALQPGRRLDTGLDPVAAISLQVTVPPNGKLTLSLATAAAPDLAELAGIVDEYQQLVHINRARMMAATLARIRQRELGLDTAGMHAVQDLTSVLLASQRRAATAEVAGFDRRMLWRFGISGDLPLIVLRVNAEHGLDLIQAVLTAQRLWQIAGVGCDVVIVNGEPASYLMPIQRQLMAMRERSISPLPGEQQAARGGVHLLQSPGLTPPELTALTASARVHLLADGRPLSRHLPDVLGTWPRLRAEARRVEPRALGGIAESRFARGGRDVVIQVDEAHGTPRPWVNVIANPGFGTVVSESGGGFTWAGNSRMNALTNWSNDALLDPCSEHFLIEDRASGEIFGALPSHDRNGSRGYRVTHTQGLSSFEHERGSLHIEAQVSVHAEERIKYLRLRIVNDGEHAVSLRVLGLVEWVFGQQRQDRMTLATSYVAGVQAALARQREHAGGFGGGVAFLSLVGAQARHWTCDRSEFFDSHGRFVMPRLLAGTQGGGLDPCAAIEALLDLKAGEPVQLLWAIGHGDDADAALALAQRIQQEGPAPQAAVAAQDEWAERLGALTVRTPDAAFDALVNHWLLYQTLSCRIWAKAGFYQAGGATGFRDQLQDAMALVYTEPQRLREQILLHASRQFPEGDVQHWWHAPTGAGVRTHFSDDLLWLPYAVIRYLEVTGDASLLDAQVPYLEGAEVPAGAEDAYYVPAVSPQASSLYEHSARAIERSLRFGAHGLPLMGSGDWNDGMNRVGHEGRGESVWLGWFLLELLRDFTPLALGRDDAGRAEAWQRAQHEIAQAMQHHGWDGDWYRRAYFDNGEPLGSHLDAECQIDLIAQAWSVFARRPGHAEDERRARLAMENAHRRLVDPHAGVVRLLDPPLNTSANHAGYIQAYPPGVRENGGQYTHAGVWAVMAFAELGQADRAWEAFCLLSPAHRAATPEQQQLYRIEPYVMAGDTYSEPPYEGWGGWSWYTGSAAWMYRAAVESILGLNVRGERIRIRPCLPPHWREAEFSLRVAGRVVHVHLQAQASEVSRADARPLAPGEWLDLAGSASECHVVVIAAVPPVTADECTPAASPLLQDRQIPIA